MMSWCKAYHIMCLTWWRQRYVCYVNTYSPIIRAKIPRMKKTVAVCVYEGATRKREVGGHVSEGRKSAIHVLGHSEWVEGVQTHVAQVKQTHKMMQYDVTDPIQSINPTQFTVLRFFRYVPVGADDWGEALSRHFCLPWHAIREFLFIDALLTCGLYQGDLNCCVLTRPGWEGFLFYVAVTFHIN